MTGAARSRRWNASLKVLAVVLAITMVGPLPHVTVVSAQAPPSLPLNCGINGLCVSGTVTNLLGLATGQPLTVTGLDPHPKSHVVQTPGLLGWVSLEAEARAELADLHDVANDPRLPRAALDELRALIFLRLISLATKEHNSQPLTEVERTALSTFKRIIADRRPKTAQYAIDEYNRWKSDPCHYRVPKPSRPAVFNFSFDEYDPGPGCGLELAVLFGGVRPPTADQFTAYGSALAKAEFIQSADVIAAYQRTDKEIALAVALTTAAAVTAAAGIGALLSTATAGAFAAIAGSAFLTTSTLGIGIAAAGVGAAVALPLIIILGVAFSIIQGIQVVEDSSVLPTLQERLAKATTPPDIWAMSKEPIARVELLTAVVDQTIPSAASLAAAGPDLGAIPPPAARQPGDPRFQVAGTLEDVIETVAPDGRHQQTFMSSGWFVTRTAQTTGIPTGWGPWEWKLSLKYRGANLSDSGYHSAGILPDGFFDAHVSQTAAADSFHTVASLQTLGPALQAQTVTWSGNHAPRLAPTVSETPEVSLPVLFKANASDSDGTITQIKWFLEDPTFAALRPSTAECSLNPPGRIDPVSGFAYGCAWRPIDDTGTGIGYTYARPGIWNVRVMAEDNDGAISSEQFTVTIGNLAPTLTLTRLPFLVLPPAVASTPEGQPVRIDGTVNYPGLPNGTYGALTTLVVDWGDGVVTKRAYPCSDSPLLPSDRSCVIQTDLTGAAATVFAPVPLEPPLPHGPWSFSLFHTYAYGGGGHLFTNPAHISVYAVTTLNGRSQTERMDANIDNVTPAFDTAYTCPLVQSNPFGVLCIGGDIREAAIGAPVTIRGRIIDTPSAGHFVRVSWGDGTSSTLMPGCAEPGCPGTVLPWSGATVPPNSPAPKYLSVSHAYQATGSYPITISVDDFGPGGSTSYSTSALAFGVSAPVGPTDVPAGSTATYSYTSTLPPGGTATVTPACGGGQVTGPTASGFTCVFGNVASPTAAKVSLHAVIAGAAFDRSLDVTISPRLSTISPLTGPTVVTAGTTATYTFTETHPAGGITFFFPSCGAYGQQTSGDGSSLTCKFTDVPGIVTTDVSIGTAGPGGSVSSSLAVTVMPDTAPPVLTLPATIRVNSTSHAGATAPFNVTAVDAVSGPSQVIICNASSGTVFPIGASTVTCSAGDWKGNTATGSFTVIVRDVTRPSLALPAAQTLDATGPAGAVATFVATAADAAPLSPVVSCVPKSGATFKIGTTSVACTAVDAAGNRASGQFAITVRGASAQVAALQTYINGLPTDATVKKALLAAVKLAAASVAANRRAACPELAAVGVLANAGARTGKLTAAQANRIVSDVTRIRAVLGC